MTSAPLLTLNKVSKTFASHTLFFELSMGVSEYDRIGLLGPNGSGKSTLLKIIAEIIEPDEGSLSKQKGVRSAYVPQDEAFEPEDTLLQSLKSKLISLHFDPLEAEVQAAIHLSQVGFTDHSTQIKTLSGGWRKRLSLAGAFAQDPDLLILDEPTNHMDWEGIFWLESQLKKFKRALLLVSHDRTLLDNLTNKTMEIHRQYREGYFLYSGHYSDFLEKREDYLKGQAQRESALSNRARRETEWLRAGVKARTTKGQGRIKKAHELFDELEQVKSQNRASNAQMQLAIASAGKLSKKLIETDKLSIFYDDFTLLENLDLILGPQQSLGILGLNGSGKTSLLKIIAQQAQNFRGKIFHAPSLKITYFDQKREEIPKDQTLTQYLGDGGNFVNVNGNSIAVAGYARRFLFSSEKLQLKISQLSGGEQARLLMAKLLLQPVDLLILDEPTNDLDIDSIEILEEALANFPGLLIVVSHDRYFLKQLCKQYLALDGQGGWQLLAAFNQWKRNKIKERGDIDQNSKKDKPQNEKKKPVAKKLTFKEKRQLETIETDILGLESEIQKTQLLLEDPSVMGDYKTMNETTQKLTSLQGKVESLYELWEDLEARK